MARLRQRGVLVVLALLAVVNLPFLHGAWIDRQVDRDGVDVTAEVTAARSSGDGGLVEFRFDEVLDPDQQTWTAALDGGGFARAEDDDTVDVRVVPTTPQRYRVDGERGAGVLLGLTGFADVVLLLALVLMLRRAQPQVAGDVADDVTDNPDR